MLIAGSVDGAYRVTGLKAAGSVAGDASAGSEVTVERVLDSERVSRLRQFDGVPGVFAATDSGLFHSTDGTDWTDLGVPTEKAYSVAVSPDGDRIYSGTRPAHVYAATLPEDGVADLVEDDWRDLEGFQELPSREEWRLPRHENLAQVRDVHVTAADPDRVVAGVEVGGVHVSTDGGETWTERRNEAHEDVHELAVAGADEWFAATGFGLFRTTDAGRSWTRLDEAVDQRYFRAVGVVDGTVYAGANMAHSSTWEDDDADGALFVLRAADLNRVDHPGSDALERVDHPRDGETVTGVTEVDGRVVAGTHRGGIVRQTDDGFVDAGSIPVPADEIVAYTPLSWFET